VGNSAVDLLLASPATGPVDKVWFSDSGGTLYARTRSGKIFETADYEVWLPSQNTTEPALQPAPSVVRNPENGARLVATGFGRIYAAGRQLYRSDDGGRSWANLTAFKTESVIGLGQRSVAVSPANQDQIVVANEFGVWRSLDGGLSWAGLNELLPNLRIQRILATPAGTAGTRAEIDGMGAVELPPGGAVWQPVDDRTKTADAVRLGFYAERAGVVATAYARSERTVYVGTADGRILISRDDGANFAPTDTGSASGPVERIFVDPARPDVALAALGGSNVPQRARFTWPRTGAFSGRRRTWITPALPTSTGSACRTVCRPVRVRPTCGWTRRVFNSTLQSRATAYMPRRRRTGSSICGWSTRRTSARARRRRDRCSV
jgi:photosystem II stability/assembly factor-like uncharacterized protein